MLIAWSASWWKRQSARLALAAPAFATPATCGRPDGLTVLTSSDDDELGEWFDQASFATDLPLLLIGVHQFAGQAGSRGADPVGLGHAAVAATRRCELRRAPVFMYFAALTSAHPAGWQRHGAGRIGAAAGGASLSLPNMLVIRSVIDEENGGLRLAGRGRRNLERPDLGRFANRGEQRRVLRRGSIQIKNAIVFHDLLTEACYEEANSRSGCAAQEAGRACRSRRPGVGHRHELEKVTELDDILSFGARPPWLTRGEDGGRVPSVEALKVLIGWLF